MLLRQRRGAHFEPKRAGLPRNVMFVMSGVGVIPCRCARYFFDRLRGLLGAPRQAYAKEALLLENCASIHTNGMSYPIDVLFVDVNPCDSKHGAHYDDGRIVGETRILASYRAVPPGEVLSCPGSHAAVERPASDEPWPLVGDTLVYIYREGGVGDAEAYEPLVRT